MESNPRERSFTAAQWIDQSTVCSGRKEHAMAIT
jgi:hypothetical protein